MAGGEEGSREARRRHANSAPPYLDHATFTARLRARATRSQSMRVYDSGFTVCNRDKSRLSPGCLACKTGTWICVFPGFDCNATCEFCPRLTVGNLDRQMDRVALDVLFALTDGMRGVVEGVSVSGGEPFYRYFETTREVVRRVKARLPGVYLWVYTNGIAATPDSMQMLRDDGLDELRFDLAATDFAPEVMGTLERAVRIFPWVTVEVPSYERTRDRLVAGGELTEIAGMGVKQLNLAEIRVPWPAEALGDTPPATRTFFASRELYTREGRSGATFLSLVESRFCTFDIADFARTEGIDIVINDCSQDAKALQLLSRQLTGTAIVQRFASHHFERSAANQRESHLARALLRQLGSLSPTIAARAVLAVDRLLRSVGPRRRLARTGGVADWTANLAEIIPPALLASSA